MSARSRFARANLDGADTTESGRGTAAARSEQARRLYEALTRAKSRLDTLDWYPEPVRIDRVRVVIAPRFFRIPGFRRYSGYAFWRTIVLKSPAASDDLVTHELCHVWQGQHRPFHMTLKHLTTRYERNPYELEARRAVAETRGR